MEQLDLGPRTVNVLRSNDINTLRDLLFKSKKRLMVVRNIGEKGINSISLVLNTLIPELYPLCC